MGDYGQGRYKDKKSNSNARGELKRSKNIFGSDTSNELNFNTVSAEKIGKAVITALSAGSAIMFGYSARKGIASVYVFIDDEKEVAYANDEAAFEKALEAVISNFGLE